MAEKKETLVFVAKKLSEAKLKWALIGSTNLELQGMDVVPKRIGIVMRDFNKEKVQELFRDCKIIKSFVLPNGEGEEIIYLADGNEVQFCFEYAHGFYVEFLKKEKFEIVELGGQKIPCLKLEDEANGYEYLGRKEKAEKIREFLRSK